MLRCAVTRVKCGRSAALRLAAVPRVKHELHHRRMASLPSVHGQRMVHAAAACKSQIRGRDGSKAPGFEERRKRTSSEGRPNRFATSRADAFLLKQVKGYLFDRTGTKGSECHHILENRFQQSPEDFSPDTLAFWMKAMSMRDGPLVTGKWYPQLLPLVLRRVHELTPKSICFVANALLTGGYTDSRMYLELVPAAVQQFRAAVASGNPSERLAPQDISNLAYIYAKAAIHSPELFDALCQAAIHLMSAFNTQEASNLVWAYATLGLDYPDVFNAVEKHALTKIPNFNGQDIANIMWAYAKAAVPAPELFAAICEHVPNVVKTMTPQALTNVVWALATAGDRSETALACAHFLIPSLEQALQTPQHVANTVWSYAKLGAPAPTLFATAARQAMKTGLSGFSPQELSSTIFGFAAGGVVVQDLFAAVQKEVMSRPQQFTAWNTSVVLWSFSKSDVSAPALFAVCEKHILSQLQDCTPATLANLMASFAGMSTSSPHILDGLAHHAVQNMHQWQDIDLSSVCQAYSSLPGSYSHLYAAMAQRATELINTNRCSFFHCCTILNGFSKADALDEPLFTLFIRAAEASYDKDMLMETPNLMPAIFSACGRYGAPAPELFGHLYKVLPDVASQFRGHDFASLAYGLARVGVWVPGCVNLAQEVTSRAPELLPQDLSTVLWWIVMYDQWWTQPDLVVCLTTVWAQLCAQYEETQGQTFSVEDYLMIAFVLLSMRFEAPALGAVPPPALLLTMIGKSTAESNQTVQSSKGHEELSKALMRVWPHENEVALMNGWLICDMVNTDKKQVVEFDGPFHFLRDGSHEPATRLKTRILKTLGFEVVRFSHKWIVNANYKKDKMQVLREHIPWLK